MFIENKRKNNEAAIIMISCSINTPSFRGLFIFIYKLSSLSLLKADESSPKNSSPTGNALNIAFNMAGEDLVKVSERRSVIIGQI